ncbi:MAG TPA: hypothetical protein VLK65_23870 [Vicinamibacteria bacterium]|nr:hypothetical protein [Vicinamibacteria bacterium]
MSIVGLALIAVGGVAALVTGILILVQAFKESVLWGLGSLLVPFVILIFVVTHWSDTGKLFLYNIGASAVLLVGSVMAGLGTQMSP